MWLLTFEISVKIYNKRIKGERGAVQKFGTKPLERTPEMELFRLWLSKKQSLIKYTPTPTRPQFTVPFTEIMIGPVALSA